jgi:type II secretory ATPase GspE/PulE/Tfp pilus assembly ATPase PilB-like protein
LIERGLIDAATLRRALLAQERTLPHRLLGQLLVDAGAFSPAQLNGALSEWLGVNEVDLRLLTPAAEALERLPRAIAEREGVLPLMVRGDTLVAAVPDPWDHTLLDQLRFVSELRIVPVIAVPGTLAPAVARAYSSAAPRPGNASAPRDTHDLAAELAANGPAPAEADSAIVSESDNTLVRLVNRLIGEAIERRASDIHIQSVEPPQPMSVRLRIDGNLVHHLELPASYRFALVARLKIMADLDISEHRKPQDGKIDFARFGGPHVELRIVTVPTRHGHEDVVLRLLSGLKPMPLDSIGLAEPNLAGLRLLMSRPYGLILICGPTGCGKTTTLHSVLREMNTEERNIWTAEDPVEITQAGLRQVQVNARIGWTFAAAMRTFLRADPDVIMIGEMRDEETARIAVEASLTGHLVMSTLHTNSAAESVTRLLEIGIDPFTFADSLLGVMAQRLVRRLCTACRRPEPMADDSLQGLARDYLGGGVSADQGSAALIERWRRQHGDEQGRLRAWHRHGCEQCDGHGYRGRLGLHELLVADERLRLLIHRRAPASELLAAALAGGMVTLRQDGIDKVLAGLTDMSEVIAATNA